MGGGNINVLHYKGLGISHEQNNAKWQDSVQFKYLQDGNVIMALSDGAGSSEYADIAADSTTKAIIHFFENSQMDSFGALTLNEQKKKILDACQVALDEEKKRINCFDNSQFLATLLFVYIYDKQLYLGHIGDGAIFLLNTNGDVYVSDPENSYGILNYTYFTLSSDALEHFRFEVVDLSEYPCDYILMTSDGAYTMLRNRGDGDAKETFLELAGYCREDIIENNEDLKDVLSQMTQVPADRMDDWSLIVCDINGEKKSMPDLPIISMLSEELEKMEIDEVEQMEVDEVEQMEVDEAEQMIDGYGTDDLFDVIIGDEETEKIDIHKQIKENEYDLSIVGTEATDSKDGMNNVHDDYTPLEMIPNIEENTCTFRKKKQCPIISFFIRCFKRWIDE